MNVCASIPGANGDKSAKSLKGMQGRGDVGMVFRLTLLWGLRGHDWCLVSDPGLFFYFSFAVSRWSRALCK